MVLIGAYIALTFTVSEVISLQVCGKTLADMLDLVCDGRGFHWTPRDNLPRITKRTALQYLNVFSEPSNTGRRTGVVNECCKRPCSYSHLESYCAAGPGTYHPYPTSGPLPLDAAQILMSNPTRSTVPRRTPAPPTSTPPPPVAENHSRIGILPVTSTSSPPTAVYNCRRVINGVRIPCFRSNFFFVRPVGPRPTRLSVI